MEFPTINTTKRVIRRARRIRLDLVVPYEARAPKEEYIARYKTQNLSKFPPILVCARRDGRFNIVNGHHRYYARKDLGLKTIMAWVMQEHEYTLGLEVLWRGRVFAYDSHMWSRSSHRNWQSSSRELELDNGDVLI